MNRKRCERREMDNRKYSKKRNKRRHGETHRQGSRTCSCSHAGPAWRDILCPTVGGSFVHQDIQKESKQIKKKKKSNSMIGEPKHLSNRGEKKKTGKNLKDQNRRQEVDWPVIGEECCCCRDRLHEVDDCVEDVRLEFILQITSLGFPVVQSVPASPGGGKGQYEQSRSIGEEGNERLNGWMGGGMNGRMDGWMNQWRKERQQGRSWSIHRWMDEWIKSWIKRKTKMDG